MSRQSTGPHSAGCHLRETPLQPPQKPFALCRTRRSQPMSKIDTLCRTRRSQPTSKIDTCPAYERKGRGLLCQRITESVTVTRWIWSTNYILGMIHPNNKYIFDHTYRTCCVVIDQTISFVSDPLNTVRYLSDNFYLFFSRADGFSSRSRTQRTPRSLCSTRLHTATQRRLHRASVAASPRPAWERKWSTWSKSLCRRLRPSLLAARALSSVRHPSSLQFLD